MHIAILEAGRTNPKMPAKFHDYFDMFETLFADQSKNTNFKFSNVAVIDGEFPESVDDYDGYLITGSAYGVYDDAPFIPTLMAFIRIIYTAGKPLVGVCFGHQIIAQALGGTCIKWPGGWGVGTYDVALDTLPDWMPGRETVRLIHFHQDQVTALPEGAVHLGSTSFCQNAMYYIGDTVFSMQGHPEFSADYTGALLDLREDTIGGDRVAKAHDDLKQEHEGITIAGWILAFFNSHMASRSAA